MPRRYVIITPCRDEAEFLPTTIESVARQTHPPTRWVIVDDGSTDQTPAILDDAMRRHPFIRVLRRDDRGRRAVGPGVIEAFYAGLETVDLDAYDYLCKLDGDLDLPPTYFEHVMDRFEQDPWLGNFSGKSYVHCNGRLVSERLGDENAIGAAKFYRVKCFRDIGGFVRQVSWDGIDGHMCRMNGWIAGSVDEPGLRFVHLRRMGSSQRGIWSGRLRWGRGKYFMGSTLDYVLAVAAYRMLERPFVIGGLGILLGYLQAMLDQAARFEDEAYLRHFRRYERRCLWRGRRRVLEETNQWIRHTVPRDEPEPAREAGSVSADGTLETVRAA